MDKANPAPIPAPIEPAQALENFQKWTELSGRGQQMMLEFWAKEHEVKPPSDPMGMYRYRRRSPDAEVALVLPRFTSLVVRPEVRELEASVAAPRAGSGTDMFGVREYRPGDPLRRIRQIHH